MLIKLRQPVYIAQVESSIAEDGVEDDAGTSPTTEVKLKGRKRKLAQKAALRKKRKMIADDGEVSQCCLDGCPSLNIHLCH